MLRFDTPTARLRSAAFLEGLSYVLLLFVAMPLKYAAGEPRVVTMIGAIHGALFLWLGALVLRAMRTRGRRLAWGARIGIASLLPFGTFVLDSRLREEDEAFRSGADETRTRPVGAR
jgi:integral membrane protein